MCATAQYRYVKHILYNQDDVLYHQILFSKIVIWQIILVST